MGTRISVPDSICLNEVRIAKESVASIPVRKCFFDSDQRQLLGQPLREAGGIPVFAGRDCVFLMRTKRQGRIRKRLSEGVSLNITDDVESFSDLPDDIARRFVFALIKKTAEPLGFYQGDGWQFFSLKTEFQNGYDAVNVDIRAEQGHYGIYLDPTVLILLPLTEIARDHLYPYRPLIRIVAPSDTEKMEQWNHSCSPGWVGLFVGIDDGLASDSDPPAPDSPVLARRARRATETLRYPAFALRVIAARGEADALGLPREQRKKTQPLAYFRLQRTLGWANRLFRDDTLTVNDRQIPVENNVSALRGPSRYPELKGWPCLWYPPTPLLFDPTGNKTNEGQMKGLREHGPFDQSSQTRPFSQMQPYCIVPDDSRLIRLSSRFFEFLADGYRKRTTADFPDDDFEGISPTTTFRIELIPPANEDVVIVDGTVAEYEQAAKGILRRWAIKENRSHNRIVVVVVPNLYDDDANEDEEDPYLSLKKIFVEGGLPSQMIETYKLDGVDDPSVAFGHVLWTFALDLYVKMGGKPWTLLRPMSNVNCLLGLGFGRDRKAVQNPIYIGIASIFDEGGQWLSLASDDRELTSDDLLSIENREYGVAGTNSYKLHQELTRKIVSDSLSAYATPPPARIAAKVVLHKNGRVYESEALGFLQAFSSSIENSSGSLSSARFALVSIYQNHNLRMYGPYYPDSAWNLRNTVTKGSVYMLNDNTALVATTGKKGNRYFGIGTPRPIRVERFVPSVETLSSTGFNVGQMYSIEEICEQVLALTKLHWGATRDIRLPVTSEYAQRIARVVARSKIRADAVLQWTKLWWI